MIKSDLWIERGYYGVYGFYLGFDRKVGNIEGEVRERYNMMGSR